MYRKRIKGAEMCCLKLVEGVLLQDQKRYQNIWGKLYNNNIVDRISDYKNEQCGCEDR